MKTLPKIEKGIPIPERAITVRKKLFSALEIGDSFAMDSMDSDVYRQAKRAGIKIELHKVNGQGYRVWRVG